MSHVFTPWAERLDAATDEGSQRALLGEIAVWRISRLADINAQRAASWALSEVHHRLGNPSQAAKEAQELLALCGIAPDAGAEVRRLAEQQATRTDPSRRSRAPRPPREERPPREDRSERPPRAEREARPERPARGERAPQEAARAGSADPIDAALHLAREGRWSDARGAVTGAKGPKAELLRAWAGLEEALSSDAASFGPRVRAVADGLAGWFGPGRAAAPARPTADDPLGALLGHATPGRREALIEALEAHLARRPGDADRLAAAALRQHVAREGLRATAPWLAGFVGRALAAGSAPQTEAALRELEGQGAFAVTAYREPAFRALVEVAKVGVAAGASLRSLRRGVLHRGEPIERRLWTLRLVLADGGERLLVAAASESAPYEDGLAGRLAGRVRELSPAALLTAPGAGNAGLRDAAAAAGLAVADDTDPAALFTALTACAPSDATPAETAAAPPAERPARGPSPSARLAALFEAEDVAAPEAYLPVLEELRRAFRAFGPVRRALANMAPEEADRRLAPLLSAIHQHVPEGVRLAEGTTLAVRTAAAAPGGAIDTLLREGGGFADRFGGPGIVGALDQAQAAVKAGATIDRVLTSTSRRERETQPALAALSGPLGGLWRLLVSADGRRGELWWLEGLTPEGRAATPLLRLEDRPRVIVAAEGEEVTGDDVLLAPTSDALAARFATWPVAAAPAAEDEEG